MYRSSQWSPERRRLRLEDLQVWEEGQRNRHLLERRVLYFVRSMVYAKAEFGHTSCAASSWSCSKDYGASV